MSAAFPGEPKDVVARAREAVRAVGGRHLPFAPGCGVAMTASLEDLQALRAAAEGAR